MKWASSLDDSRIFFKLTQYACKLYVFVIKNIFFFNNAIEEGQNVIYIFFIFLFHHSFYACDEIWCTNEVLIYSWYIQKNNEDSNFFSPNINCT